MPASTAAPTSSAWTCTFQSPSPPTTTSESPSGAVPGAARDGVVLGLEEVHHLVGRTVLGEVTGRELRPGSPGCRRGACPVVARLPVIADSAASRTTHSPRPPASTTPASRSIGSCSGVRARASRARSAAARTTRQPVVGTSARLAAASERRARRSAWCPRRAGRPRRRRRRSPSPYPRRTPPPTVVRPGLADPSQQGADSWLRITPELPRAPSRRPARTRASPSRRSPGPRAASRTCVAGRLDGEEHVGAGVAVGDRIDVEGVDLLARRGRPRRQDREAAHDIEIEGGDIRLTPSSVAPPGRGLWRGSR